MKKYNPKIKAFTLSEMIVVLLLTIVVVSLAFSVLNLVQKQMGSMSDNYEDHTELNLLRQALTIDFGTYPDISFDNTTQILGFANEMEYTHYRFEKEQVLRGKDTFNLELTNLLFYFDGREISNGSIDAIKLSTGPEKIDKNVFIYNENAAAEYMY
ncbi:MAG: hypothetical protein ABJN95_05590 [Maribacter sp.]|uniref:hypothetical protein n=1 Tax=Maribacter sp. TaxID=1897614 RepID=UPI0032989DDE